MDEKGKLTQEEANRLIKMLKSSLIDEINFPPKGKSIEFDAKGDTKQDVFTVKIFRSKIKYNKYTFGARIRRDGIILLELHINPSNPHTNPDGTQIIGSHWHVYKEGYDRKFAYPAGNIKDDDFVDNTLLFFERFNLILKPKINYQLELIP